MQDNHRQFYNCRLHCRMLNNVLDDKKPVLKPIPPSLERQSTLNGIKEGNSSLKCVYFTLLYFTFTLLYFTLPCFALLFTLLFTLNYTLFHFTLLNFTHYITHYIAIYYITLHYITGLFSILNPNSLKFSKICYKYQGRSLDLTYNIRGGNKSCILLNIFFFIFSSSEPSYNRSEN